MPKTPAPQAAPCLILAGQRTHRWNAAARRLPGVLGRWLVNKIGSTGLVVVALSLSVLSGCASSLAEPTPLAFRPAIDYPTLVQMTRALQSDPNDLVDKVVARHVRLTLMRYSHMPERLHQIDRTEDLIDFVCLDSASFAEGPTKAQIVRFEAGVEGAVTYWLTGCGVQQPK